MSACLVHAAGRGPFSIAYALLIEGHGVTPPSKPWLLPNNASHRSPLVQKERQQQCESEPPRVLTGLWTSVKLRALVAGHAAVQSIYRHWLRRVSVGGACACAPGACCRLADCCQACFLVGGNAARARTHMVSLLCARPGLVATRNRVLAVPRVRGTKRAACCTDGRLLASALWKAPHSGVAGQELREVRLWRWQPPRMQLP